MKDFILKIINLCTALILISEIGMPFCYTLFSRIKIKMVDLWFEVDHLEKGLEGGGDRGTVDVAGEGNGEEGEASTEANAGSDPDNADGDNNDGGEGHEHTSRCDITTPWPRLVTTIPDDTEDGLEILITGGMLGLVCSLLLRG